MSFYITYRQPGLRLDFWSDELDRWTEDWGEATEYSSVKEASKSFREAKKRFTSGARPKILQTDRVISEQITDNLQDIEPRRRLRHGWSVESADDLEAIHGIDALKELIGLTKTSKKK